MTIKLASPGGADDLKQQGWLSKIVPPPKEATALVSAVDPGAFGGGGADDPFLDEMRSQCPHTKYLLVVALVLACCHSTRSAVLTASSRAMLRPARFGWRHAGGQAREQKRRSDAGAASCLDEANHSCTLEQGMAVSLVNSGSNEPPLLGR